jgi:hypothetical protein
MAGTVTVLRGQIRVKSTGPDKGGTTIPTQVVGHDTVARNAKFRFVLPPGHYVLRAHFPSPSTYAPITGFSVKDATPLHVDIPNECI